MAICVGDGAEQGGAGLVLPGDAPRLGIYTIDYTIATSYIDVLSTWMGEASMVADGWRE